jgi:hypothetical protein
MPTILYPPISLPTVRMEVIVVTGEPEVGATYGSTLVEGPAAAAAAAAAAAEAAATVLAMARVRGLRVIHGASAGSSKASAQSVGNPAFMPPSTLTRRCVKVDVACLGDCRRLTDR